MTEIRNLLNQVSIIIKKNADFFDATGGRFNMFKLLGVDHYENTHSAILAELLNPKGTHGLKNEFLKIFVSRLINKETISDFNCENVSIRTEVNTGDGRIDILIEDNQQHALIIENKIYAADQWAQLKRYNSWAVDHYGNGNYHILYLTLDGKEPSYNSRQDVEYVQISYSSDILAWLEECVNLSARFPLVRETINQYINHLKQLTNQDMSKFYQEELANLLAKPENIQSAVEISRNVESAKFKILSDFAIKIANEVGLLCDVNDNRQFGFYKENWENGSRIWFGVDNGKVYYSIKTEASLKCRAVPQKRIEALFTQKSDACNPFGYGYILNENWDTNNSLFLKMIDYTLAIETILPNLKKVLDYINEHLNLITI